MTEPGAAEPSPVPLHVMLDHWCGERFDAEVADRLAAMPREQAAHLLDAWRGWARSATVAARAPGELRVFWNYNFPVVGGAARPEDMWPHLLPSLLLYSHRVVTGTVLPYALKQFRDHGSSAMLANELHWLADYRQLMEDGTVVVLPPHPNPDVIPLPEPDIQPDIEDMRWIMETEPSKRKEIEKILLWLGRYDVRRQLIEARRCDTEIVLASRLTEQIFEALFSSVTVQDVPRSRPTERLLTCVLPIAVPTPAQIAAVRRAEKAFVTWRSQLTQALTAADSIGDGRDWRRDVPAILAEHLTAPAQRLQKTMGRSAALSSLKNSSVTFTIAGIGAATATYAGGKLDPALAGAAAAGGAGLLREYLKQARAHRANKALLAHYLALVPNHA